MSILKYILSPFVEFNEPDQGKEAAQPGQAAGAPVNYQSAPIGDAPPPLPNTSNPGSSSNNNNNDFNAHFDQLIEEANQKNPLFQGADLKEYLDTKIELSTIGDEGDKIKTAFNILKKTGLTKDKLLTTGQEYIKLIEHDLAGIEGAFSQQYKNDVELKEQLIQSKMRELQTLNDKINAVNNEVSRLTQQITQSKAQLSNNKDKFILAGQQKKSELEIELQKINQYL